MSLPNDEFPEFDEQLNEPGTGGEGEAPEEAPEQLSDDWTQDPRYQQLQSSMQRAHNEDMRRAQDQINQLTRLVETTTMSYEQLKRRNDAISQAVRNLGSEEQAVFVEQMAELEELRAFKEKTAEREQQREQQEQARSAWEQWKQNKELQITAMGLDPNDPALQTGIMKTLETGDDTHLLMAVKEAMTKKSAGQNSPEGEQRQRQTGVRPPSGGVTPNMHSREAKVNQLRKERQEAIERAKNTGGDWKMVRNDYAQKARALGIDPRDIEPQV